MTSPPTACQSREGNANPRFVAGPENIVEDAMRTFLPALAGVP
jgi:hypothetical protein